MLKKRKGLIAGWCETVSRNAEVIGNWSEVDKTEDQHVDMNSTNQWQSESQLVWMSLKIKGQMMKNELTKATAERKVSPLGLIQNIVRDPMILLN